MKSILPALKTAIPAAVSSIEKIEVIPHEELLPDTIRYPFVGLKDGGTRSDGGLDPLTNLRVDIWCYVEILKPEASILGDTATSKTGILDLSESVLNAVLAAGTLGLSDVIGVEADTTQPPSEPGWHGDVYIQRQRKTVYYTKNE